MTINVVASELTACEVNALYCRSKLAREISTQIGVYFPVTFGDAQEAFFVIVCAQATLRCRAQCHILSWELSIAFVDPGEVCTLRSRRSS